MKDSQKKFLNPLYTNYVKEEIKARSKNWIVPAKVSGYICPCCHSGDGPHGTGIMESKKFPNQFCCFSSRTGECWEGYQDIIGIVRHMYKASFFDALEIAAEKVGYELPDPELFKDEENLPAHTVPILKSASPSVSPAAMNPPKQEEIDAIQKELARYRANIDQTDYYKKRGLSRETVLKFGCGFCPVWQHPFFASLDLQKEKERLEKALIDEGYGESWDKICKEVRDPYQYFRKYHPMYLASHGIHLSKPRPSERFIIPTSDGTAYLARLASPVVTDFQKRFSKMKAGKQVTGFNWSILLKQKKSPVIVTEGEFDAMSVEEVGFPALALGSVTMMNNFCAYIRENKIKPAFPPILALDNDPSGRSWTVKMVEALRKEGIFSIHGNSIILSGTKDPNESLCKDREAFSSQVKRLVEESRSLRANFTINRGI